MIKLFLIILLLANSAISSFPLFDLQTPNNQTLELIERKTKAFVEGPYAEIQYIETYKNPFTNPVEAKFLFHRSQDYFFNKFELIIANETILYEVHEKPVNTERTNQIEIDPQQAKVTSDLIDIHLGSLLPHQTVQIILSVAQPLQVHLFKFYELRLSAPHQNLKEWNIEVEIRSDRPLEILSNPTHQLKPILSQPTPNLYLTFYKATLYLSKDFTVYFAPEDLPKLQISSAVHPDNPADHLILLSAVPDAKYFSPEYVQNVLESQPENGLLELYKKAFKIEMRHSLSQYILMLDRSDSMKGEPLENLKRVVLALLRTLPESHDVDILSFGSTFEFYRPDKKFYRLPTARKAMEWVKGIQADMGDKDLLEPLEDIVKDYDWGQVGQQAIIIFTDGSNSDEILEMIYSLDHIQVCAVGINPRASQDIIQSLNQESRCQGEFVIDDQDLDERAFRFMKENFMGSTYFLLNFDVECHKNQNRLVYEDHLAEEGVFMDRPWVRWIYLDKNVDFKSCKLDLSFYDCYEDISFEEEKMTIYEKKDARKTDLYHKIAYGIKINELKKELERSRPQYRNGINQQIIDFSTRYQIPSELTVLIPRLQNNAKRVNIQPLLIGDL